MKAATQKPDLDVGIEGAESLEWAGPIQTTRWLGNGGS